MKLIGHSYIAYNRNETYSDLVHSCLDNFSIIFIGHFSECAQNSLGKDSDFFNVRKCSFSVANSIVLSSFRF